MENVNRYGCGNGEGMFDDSEGYWVAHKDYKELLDKYEKLALTIPVVVKSLPQDNYCEVCNLPTDGEKCYSKRCPI